MMRTLDGKVVYAFSPGNIKDTRDFIERYQDVEGFDVYGNTNYAYQYISDNFPNEIKYNKDLIKVFSLDIETTTEEGFPNIETANEEILLISMMDNKTKRVTVFGRKDYNGQCPFYQKFESEAQLLREFVKFWRANCPDIITGWNINLFDIPYLVQRIINVLGEEEAKKLSPWGMTTRREIYVKGNKEIAYDIIGVSILDYIDLYKKFTYSAQESYRLDYICEQELGQNKLENLYDTFKDFYTKDWDRFVDYNIHDTALVDMLEDKMRLIELAMVMAYNARVNYEDVFSQVRMWDTIIYNYLRAKKVVIPPKNKNSKNETIEGAYVKDPILGYHKWVVSFDLNSLYPHLIMQYNISPETISGNVVGGVELFLKQAPEDNGKSITANGWCYRKDVRGFMPELMEKMYIDRSKAKKQMLAVQQEYENTKNHALTNEISRLNNLQMALKIALNSAYGAMANQYFRYYDKRMSEGITLSGQLSIRWIHDKLNVYVNKLLKTEGKDYIIAVDTDSVYLNMGPLVDNVFTEEQQKDTNKVVAFVDKICEERFQPYIDKCYEELAQRQNAYDQKMVMKRESIADKGIWTAKKRYILNVHNSEGVQYAEPKMKIMGLEVVKSSTPAVVRKKLKESIRVILDGDVHVLRKFVEDYRKVFLTLPVEEIAFPRGVSDIKNYHSASTIYKKATPIHVRGALLFNHYTKQFGLEDKYQPIRSGDKIKFVYLKVPNTMREDIISFPTTLPKELGLHKYVDYEKQFQKVFLDPLSSIIEAIGWEIEDKADLDDFFN
jgi:DNA polymerase elongation subunit (family B)